MGKGNPNPSPSTRIGAPNGPPPGRTSETARLALQNAEAAIRIRAKLLEAVEASLVDNDGTQQALDMIQQAMLKLLKDAEDRGLGAPVQSMISPDGSMTPRPTVIEFVAPRSDDAGDD